MKTKIEMEDLTKKQQKLLKFCVENAKTIPPTYEEMARFMGVRSKQSCFDMIQWIEKKLGRKIGDIVSSGRGTERNLRGVGSNPTISVNSTNYVMPKETIDTVRI